MNLDLGMCLNDEMKEEFVRATSFQKCETSGFNCMKLKISCKNQEEQRRQMIMNQVLNNTNHNITNINNVTNYSQGGLGNEMTQIGDNMTSISSGGRNFELELSQTEEQLRRFLEIEGNTNDILDENEKYKKFLKYMEENYKNQFNTQELNINDLKLQIEELKIKLRAERNLRAQKNLENKELKEVIEDLKINKNILYGKFREADRIKILNANKLNFSYNENSRLKNMLNLTKTKLENKENEYTVKEKRYNQIIGDLQEFITHLQNQKRDLNNELLNKDGKLKEVFRKVGRNPEIKNSSGRMAGLGSIPQEEFMKIRKVLDDKKKELLSVNKNEGILKKNLSKIKRENNDLDRKNRNYKRDMDKLRRQLDTANNDKDDLDTYCNNLKKLNNNLNSKNIRATGEKKQLANDLENEKFKNKLLEDDIKRNDEKINYLQDENIKLKNLLDDLKGKFNFSDNEMNMLAQTNEKLMREAQELKSNLKNGQDTLSSQKSEKRGLNNEINKLKRDLADEKLKSESLSDELEKYKKNNSKLKSNNYDSVADLNDKLNKANNNNLLLENKYNKAMLELDNLLKEHKNLNSDLGDLEDKYRKLQESENFVRFDRDKLNKETQGLERDVKRFKANNENLNDELREALQKVKDLENENDNLANTNKNIDRALDKANAKNKKLQGDLNDVSEEVEKEKNEKKKIHSDLINAKKAVDDQIYQRKRLENEIGELKPQMEQLKLNPKLKSKLKESEDRFNNLNFKLKETEREMELIIDNNDKLKGEFEELENKFESLENLYAKLKTQHANLNLKYDKMSNEFSEIFNESYNIYNLNNDIYEFLVEGEVSEHEPNPLKTLQPEQYSSHILNYLRGSGEQAKEAYAEIEDLKTAVDNIKVEKTHLVNRNQELEAKYEDLVKRHDRKTDMVGKLTMKNFVLFSEIERLHHNYSKK